MFPTGILLSARPALRLVVLFIVALLANGSRAAAPRDDALDQLIEAFFKPEDIHSVSLSPEGGTIAAQKYKAGGELADDHRCADAKTAGVRRGRRDR